MIKCPFCGEDIDEEEYRATGRCIDCGKDVSKNKKVINYFSRYDKNAGDLDETFGKYQTSTKVASRKHTGAASDAALQAALNNNQPETTPQKTDNRQDQELDMSATIRQAEDVEYEDDDEEVETIDFGVNSGDFSIDESTIPALDSSDDENNTIEASEPDTDNEFDDEPPIMNIGNNPDELNDYENDEDFEYEEYVDDEDDDVSITQSQPTAKVANDNPSNSNVETLDEWEFDDDDDDLSDVTTPLSPANDELDYYNELELPDIPEDETSDQQDPVMVNAQSLPVKQTAGNAQVTDENTMLSHGIQDMTTAGVTNTIKSIFERIPRRANKAGENADLTNAETLTKKSLLLKKQSAKIQDSPADRIRKKTSTNSQIKGEEKEFPELNLDFNKDGFYNDTEARDPAQPDIIPISAILKIAGVILAMFAITAFLIYWA